MIDLADAATESGANPIRALQRVDAAIAFLSSHHSQLLLPQAWLERGRAHHTAGDDSAALADFETGIAQADRQRSTIEQPEMRASFYDTNDSLFAERMALLLRHGAVSQAFATIDRSRARSLYEQLEPKADAAGAGMAEVRAVLPPSSALIEYSAGRESLIIFYVTPSGSGAVTVPAGRTALRSAVERYTGLLQRRGDDAEMRREAAALERLLIAPVVPHLGRAAQLVIVADRPLHALPFGALYDARSDRYLIERFALTYAPSAAFLLRGHGERSLLPALVVGDPRSENDPPLPAAAREAEDVAALYRPVTLLLATQATRQRFLAAARGSALIHYAGHAESEGIDRYGALHLADDDRGNALDAAEIARLKFSRAPLVVLAACGTMRGESDHVEGLPSIARAFLAAGARGVVGTLWEIDDDAAVPLFQQFHVWLRQGTTAASALRASQLDLLRSSDGRLRHPSAWASVELLGNPN